LILCVFKKLSFRIFSDNCLRLIDPSREYLWDWIPAVGKSGGVLSGIKSERFDVGSREQGNYVLLHRPWDKKKEIKWSLGNVYGAAQADHKEEFLVELTALCSKIVEPYIIGGDFNIIRFSSERNRNFCPNRFSSIFNTFINVSELREIYILGGGYTWSNNQEIPTLEKLDRILVTREWEILFPTAHVYKMARIMCDHNPLILSTQNAQRGENERIQI
jgi:hypothetical protein